MTAKELIDFLTEFCDGDAEVKVASEDTLFDVEIAASSALNIILTIDGGDVRCMACGKPAVAAPFANKLICYEHWTHFKEE